MISTPIRIGIFCPGTGTGGPWRYVYSILAGIDPSEFAVSLFCDRDQPLSDYPGVCVIPFRFPARPIARQTGESGAKRVRKAARLVPPIARLWAGYTKQAYRLARIFRSHRIELLHTQNAGCEESPIAARLAGIPRVVGTFHVDSTSDVHGVYNGVGHRVVEQVSNGCFHAAIAVSGATKRAWVRRTHIPTEKVSIIHNGIDTDRFRRRQSPGNARRAFGLPDDGRVIVGAVGRLVELKGYSDLLAAVARLRTEFPGLMLALAGDGPLRGRLENEAERLGMTDSVRFLGHLTDVQDALDAFDVFAMPSLSETLGYALLEAMATELPAVGSAVGGIPEVIVHGETGYLTPPRNPDALADALRPLIASPELRAKFGAAARERVVCHFHERNMVRRTIDLYRNLLATRSVCLTSSSVCR